MEELLDNCDLAKEILTVLPYLDHTFINILPSDLITTLTDLAANSEKSFYIQKGKSLEEQDISEECKNWLALLYYKYTDPDQQNDILSSWMKNDSTFQ